MADDTTHLVRLETSELEITKDAYGGTAVRLPMDGTPLNLILGDAAYTDALAVNVVTRGHGDEREVVGLRVNAFGGLVTLSESGSSVVHVPLPLTVGGVQVGQALAEFAERQQAQAGEKIQDIPLDDGQDDGEEEDGAAGV